VIATRVMALDVGERRIGVAISDPQGILATPHGIIDCVDAATDISAILRLAEERGVEKIVVGMPLMMDGTTGIQAGKVQAFVRQLQVRSEIPIIFRDERLTTVSAKRLLREGGRAKKPDDAVAAAFILQSYLYESTPPEDMP